MNLSSPEAYEPLSGSILVAEDNEINRFLIKKFLKKWGTTGDFAENGQEAVDKITAQSYDLILMDIHMPVMTGLEATTAIRNLEKGKERQTPIIALTATVLEHDLEEIRQSGMDDYIIKPFSPNELYSKIESFLKKRD